MSERRRLIPGRFGCTLPGMFTSESDTTFSSVAPGVERRLLARGGSMMLVEVRFAADAVGPIHQHPHEQLTFVRSGCFRFTIGEETRVIRPGDSLHVPPNVSHGCHCLEPGVLLDIFTPQREDFL